MYLIRQFLVALSLITCFLQAHGADKYTDENRPYEFGFNIEGEQHRHEKKDENGLIMGEYGFITADGVYHVTVYATDENGKFRILSMKNIRVKPYPSGPDRKMAKSLALPAAPAPPRAQAPASVQQTAVARAPQPAPTRAPLPQTVAPSNLRSCSSCKIPTTTTTTRRPPAPPAPVAPRPQFPAIQPPQQPSRQPNFPQQQGKQPNYPQPPIQQPNYPQPPSQQPNYPQPPSQQPNFPQPPSQQPNYPQPPSQQPNYPQPPSQQPNYPQQPSPQSNYPQQPNQNPARLPNQNTAPRNPQPPINSPGSFPQPSQEVAPPKRPQTLEPAIDSRLGFSRDSLGPSNNPQGTNTPQQKPQAPANRNPKQYEPNAVAKPILTYVQMQKVDPKTDIYSRKPGEKEGLPAGVSKDTVSTLLYTFNYTVGFHGHHEDGYTNGAKKGYYYVTGRNGIRTRVDYEADENGFRPKITQEVLDLVSEEVPKQETEKDEKYGLKGYEFKWLYFPDAKSR